MKKFLPVFTVIFCLVFVFSFLTGSSGGRATMDNEGNTGAPNEPTTCNSCHIGGSYGLVSLSIEVFQQGTLTPVTAYVAGTTYDMRVTVMNSAGSPLGYGFQLTALTQANNTPITGYTNLAANVKLKNITTGTWAGRTYLEHNGVINNNMFNFSWTAPVVGTGAVDFYAAGNAVDLDHNSTGDNAGTTSITLPELLPLGVTGIITPVDCNGGNNGAIDITVSGGEGPYSYDWGSGVTTEDRTGLTAGVYTVIITDNLGTSITSNYTVTQPNPLVANATNTDILCNGGSCTVSVTGSGGTFPYSGTGGFTEVAGVHTYTITDANGCSSAPFTLTITEPAVLVANAVVSTPISCNGGTGMVDISATGGTPPYNNTGTVSVASGAHTYNVIDANGCLASTTIFVQEPAILSATVVLGNPILCNGGTGTVIVNATGGTPPYTNTGSQTVNAGTGNFTVTDANGCSTTSPSITVNEPSAIVGTVVSITHNTNNNNGAIDVSVSGGTPPYTYSWSNGATTQDIQSLGAGLYTLTITDAHGCIQTMTDLAVLFHVGMEDELGAFVSIYPNPVSEFIYLRFEEGLSNVANVGIYGVDGKLIREVALGEGKEHRIDVSDLSAGGYLLVLEYGGKSYRYSWVKE